MQRVRRRSRKRWFGGAALALVGVGCSVGSAHMESGSASADVAFVDGGSGRAPATGSDGAAFPCPASPADKATVWCTPGTWCEYGSAAEQTCNDRLLCGNGRWVSIPKDCDVECPATWDELAEGTPCSSASPICTFDEGTCGCVVTDSAGDDAGADASDPDAGDASVAPPSGRWTCVRAASGCPGKRPLLGNACVNEMTCDYGSDLFGTDLSFECKASRWQ